jgi:hypothetical protein
MPVSTRVSDRVGEFGERGGGSKEGSHPRGAIADPVGRRRTMRM